MKKILIVILAISGVALAWAAPPLDRLPALLVPPTEARITNVILVGSVPAGGPAPGTLLLGNSNTTTSSDRFNGNPNTAYYMQQDGQASATVAHAYFYDDLGYETDPVHVCIWNSSGTLLGCSGNIAMTGASGWRTVAWSGPSISQGTSYYIGFTSGTSTGMWTLYDESSPAIPACEADNTNQTFGSEGAVPNDTCSTSSGSYTIYVTN